MLVIFERCYRIVNDNYFRRISNNLVKLQEGLKQFFKCLRIR